VRHFLIIVSLLFLKEFLIAQNAGDIIRRTLEKINQINTISFTITAKERFGDEYKTDKAFFKRKYNPDEIYYKQLLPPTNAEVLMNEKYKNTALVNPNGFPFINLHLSPYGERLRDKQHHTLYQAGYAYFSEILLYMKNKYKANWTDVSTLEKEVIISGNVCYKVVLKNPNYKIISYKVNKETTPQQLAAQLKICDEQFVELNPAIKNIFQKIKAGSEIIIPSDYAASIALYIDKNLLVPRKIEVNDNKGLFEEYLFENIIINPAFTEMDFDENNKEYGF
jgi:outer membrane lipoprotein-sorting protein